MPVYWSYQRLPELAQFTRRTRKIIWLNLSQERQKLPHTRSRSYLIGGSIIAAFVVGIMSGAFVARSPEIGGLVGGQAGIVVACLLVYLYGINSARGPLREYMASDSFSTLPINKTVRIFLDPLKRHDT